MTSVVRPASLRLLVVLGCSIQFAGPSVCFSDESSIAGIDEILPLLKEMKTAWAGVRDYTTVLEKQERMADGRMIQDKGIFKFRRPNLHYLEVREGRNAGAELIYPIDEQGHRALAHPGGLVGAVLGALSKIPIVGRVVPQEFDIRDPMILRHQHHTILDSNLGGKIRLISRNLSLAASDGEGRIRFHRHEQIGDQVAQKVEILLPDRAGTNHTVGKLETLWTIARKYDQDMYVILYNNPPLLDPADIEPGLELFVPKYYAPRTFLWISKSSGLPIKLEIYDREGRLYESYTYTNLLLNPGLTEKDFDPARYRF